MTTEAGLRLAGRTHEQADFDSLFLEHYAGICRYLTRLLGNAQEAEDLAQETFLRLYRQRFSAEQEHEARAWLYRVATNRAYNALRDEKRRQRRQELAASNSETVQDPVEATVQREERENVRRVLAGLPARQAEILLLRYGGLSYAEVAEALRVSPGSVGTLLARAEQTFARAYGRRR